MSVKIPADVSPLRKRLAEAAARRKLELPKLPIKQDLVKPGTLRRAGQETGEERRKRREAEQLSAEKEIRVKELEEALATAQKELAEKSPAADKWQKFDHRRKELLIAKFPKEEQARVRKFDSDALEALAEARGFSGDGGTGTGGGSKPVAGKFTTQDELIGLAKTDPAAYNKGMDDVAAGVVKFDATGKVLV